MRKIVDSTGMVIAVDFDGTCVTHKYPRVGKEIGASFVLKALTDNGHKLILWTMRDDNPRDVKIEETCETVKVNCLQEAVDWFKSHNIPLWGINNNPTQHWSKSKKQYAQLYIDDAALGAPMVNGHINWREALIRLHSLGLIKDRQITNIINDPEWTKQIDYIVT